MVFGAPSDAKGARAWADPCSQEPQAIHGVQALSQGPGPLGLQEPQVSAIPLVRVWVSTATQDPASDLASDPPFT